MRIIPAIDIINGQCVRLVNGDFQKKSVYSNDPLEVALRFEDSGIKYLHLVDLDGAKNGSPQNLSILENISSNTELEIDFGGGVSSEQDIIDIFNAGADQVNIGSLAVRDPKLVKEILIKFTSEKIILAADVLNDCIAIDAWQSETTTTIYDFLKDYKTAGLKYAVCTDISKDGMLLGPALGLYENLFEQFDLSLIASGGVKDMDDIIDLHNLGLDGVIIGKAIYEGYINLEDLSAYA